MITTMDMKATEIAHWAHEEISQLKDSGMYKNETAMYAELAALADISVSLIRAFHQGTRPNPTADTIDRMVMAIKAAKRLHAA